MNTFECHGTRWVSTSIDRIGASRHKDPEVHDTHDHYGNDKGQTDDDQSEDPTVGRPTPLEMMVIFTTIIIIPQSPRIRKKNP